MFQTRVLRIATIVLLPVITLALGWQLGASYENQALLEVRRQIELFAPAAGSGQVLHDPEQEANLSLFWGVWRLLLTHYIAPDELHPQKLILGATEGMVRAINDPYTVFMGPDETREFRQSLSGQLQGIGAELGIRDEAIVVLHPLKGSPAEASGLLPGDIIIAVDRQSTEGKTLTGVVGLIRGPKGTSVTISVLRDKKIEPVVLTIVRAEITVPSVETKMLTTATGSIGYITLNQFGDTSVADFTKALKDTLKKEPKALIIDLRFNGGGYLEGAIDVVSLFVEEGKVVSVERRGGIIDVQEVRGRPLTIDLPMVVLINQGSASASEIVAGALQDHERATIIGMKSYGKGTVQEVMDLPGNTSIRLTTARWLTPKGRNISKEGITPDVVIDRTPQQMQKDIDPQLEAAETWLLGHKDNLEKMKTGTGATKS